MNSKRCECATSDTKAETPGERGRWRRGGERDLLAPAATGLRSDECERMSQCAYWSVSEWMRALGSLSLVHAGNGARQGGQPNGRIRNTNSHCRSATELR